MTKKDLYIGCFEIKDSRKYGGNKFIQNMKPGDNVILSYASEDKLILVQWNNNGYMVTLGELMETGLAKQSLFPLLRCNKGDDLFECEISSRGGCSLNVNRLYVDVWAKDHCATTTTK